MARSPRLTQEQRRHLAVRLASRATAAEQAALDAAETALFDRLVTQLFTPAELRLLARIPPAWLDGTTGIRVRVRDDHEMRAVATVYHHGSPPRIIPHISVDDVTDRTDPALRQDVRKHDERRRAMFQRRETVKQTLYAHLARCSTHTQALALLPEAADLLAAWTKTTPDAPSPPPEIPADIRAALATPPAAKPPSRKRKA